MSRKSARKTSRKGTASRRRPISQAQASAEPRQPAKVDFATEYHYVITDLRRFGILALAMFATLVVLALALG